MYGAKNMNEQEKTLRVKVDNLTRVCLACCTALLAVLIVGIWIERPVTQANAGDLFLNTAEQRDEIIAAQDRTTAKLDELMELLRSGDVKVQVDQTDEEDSGVSRKATRKSSTNNSSSKSKQPPR